jgi:hypothetical protein
MVAVGCSVESSDPQAKSSDLSSDGGVFTCDPNEVSFIAVLKTGDCEAIAGYGGTWNPGPLFQNAPPQFHACLYSWQTSNGSRADTSALADAIRPLPGGNVLTPTCDTAPKVQRGVEAEVAVPQVAGGTVGCDVCGYVDGDGVDVVLPPDEVMLGAFTVALTDGTSQSFKVDVTTGVHAATVILPTPPVGVSYVQGPITVR